MKILLLAPQDSEMVMLVQNSKTTTAIIIMGKETEEKLYNEMRYNRNEMQTILLLFKLLP